MRGARCRAENCQFALCWARRAAAGMALGRTWNPRPDACDGAVARASGWRWRQRGGTGRDLIGHNRAKCSDSPCDARTPAFSLKNLTFVRTTKLRMLSSMLLLVDLCRKSYKGECVTHLPRRQQAQRENGSIGGRPSSHEEPAGAPAVEVRSDWPNTLRCVAGRRRACGSCSTVRSDSTRPRAATIWPGGCRAVHREADREVQAAATRCADAGGEPGKRGQNRARAQCTLCDLHRHVLCALQQEPDAGRHQRTRRRSRRFTQQADSDDSGDHGSGSDYEGDDNRSARKRTRRPRFTEVCENA